MDLLVPNAILVIRSGERLPGAGRLRATENQNLRNLRNLRIEHPLESCHTLAQPQ